MAQDDEGQEPKEGPLTCLACGGSLRLIEIYIINCADRAHRMIHFQPGGPSSVADDESPGMKLVGILDERHWPEDDDPPCTEFRLECLKCKGECHYFVRFMPNGTRIYQSGTAHDLPYVPETPRH